MGNKDLTGPPTLPTPAIELGAFHLQKKWLTLAHQLVETLTDTHLFVTVHGYAPSVQALGAQIASRIASAYADLKPIAIEYTKLTDLPDLPTE